LFSPKQSKARVDTWEPEFYWEMKIGHENVMGHGALVSASISPSILAWIGFPVSVSLPEIVIKMNLFLHW
jgi:hypothetical protein